MLTKTLDQIVDHLGAPIVADTIPTEYSIEVGRGEYFYGVSRPKNRIVFDTLLAVAKKKPYQSVRATIDGVIVYSQKSKEKKNVV